MQMPCLSTILVKNSVKKKKRKKLLLFQPDAHEKHMANY